MVTLRIMSITRVPTMLVDVDVSPTRLFGRGFLSTYQRPSTFTFLRNFCRPVHLSRRSTRQRVMRVLFFFGITRSNITHRTVIKARVRGLIIIYSLFTEGTLRGYHRHNVL